MTDRPGLVTFYDIRPGKEQVYSYNPRTHTGPATRGSLTSSIVVNIQSVGL